MSPACALHLPQIVERLCAAAHPTAILLFGSQARDEARDDSDLDLLVVLETVSDRRRRSVELRTLLADFPLAIDVLVTTPQDLAWKGQYPGTIEYTARQEGKVLHGHAA